MIFYHEFQFLIIRVHLGYYNRDMFFDDIEDALRFFRKI